MPTGAALGSRPGGVQIFERALARSSGSDGCVVLGRRRPVLATRPATVAGLLT